jgi:hypothetical protein
MIGSIEVAIFLMIAAASACLLLWRLGYSKGYDDAIMWLPTNPARLCPHKCEARGADMHRYLIFGGETFYACGGFADLIGRADTVEEARQFAERVGASYADVMSGSGYWWHIVDMHRREVVEESYEVALGGGMENRKIWHMVYMGGHLVPAAITLEVEADD